ncbi:RdRP-domain-containing protein [Cylindrobasidium torrendii FP15055 ss-10]|uniref:RNA-dependent RNA polymerase n=1 Tax=Cylindrobasidium torrendii FP15055 ss-10 TaxID=1314674 RepID=A0A0D7B3X8_9AGAR|nr:RdRP-domain-containing protein [Cylindrobasidium torrendii FP15055 ss-10]
MDRRRHGPRKSAPGPGGGYSGTPVHAGTKRRHSDNFDQRKRRRYNHQDPGLAVRQPRPFSTRLPYNPDDPDHGVVLALRGFGELEEAPDKLEVQEILELLFEEYDICDHQGRRVNFAVFTRPGPPVAFVSLPHEDLEDTILKLVNDVYSDFKVVWKGLKLDVGHSNKEVDPMLLEELRLVEYVSVEEDKRRRALARELQTHIPVERIGFGVWSPEAGLFSAEHTVTLGLRDKTMSAFYNSDRRSMIIEKAGTRLDLDYTTSHSTRLLVLIPSREIRKIWVSTTAKTVLFFMHSAVQYEAEDVDGTTRTFGFDGAHEGLVRFTSSCVAIGFQTLVHFNAFLDKLDKCDHIAGYERHEFKVGILRIYDERRFKSLSSWYTSLPLAIALQCEQAVNNRALSPKEVMVLRTPIEAALIDHGKDIVVSAMQWTILHYAGQDPTSRIASPSGLERKFEEGKAHALDLAAKMRNSKDDSSDFACHQLYVTPTGFILEGPYLDKSNRILREHPNFQEHFLRVSFTEEGGQNRKLNKAFGSNMDFDRFIHEHIGRTLKDGIKLAGKHWEWVGYSQSALKDRQMIFMTPFVDEDGLYIDSDSIRQDIGDFSKKMTDRFPAKYGARIAQAFSATSASLKLRKKEVVKMPDIKSESGFDFTDGAGDMSLDLARDVWAKISRRRLNDPEPPSAFQARIAGCKGVWMVNPELKGRLLRFTDSQEKFKSSSLTFDVANHSLHPGITYLNRPLVKVLEDLGVSKQTFLDIQKHEVEQIEKAVRSFPYAAVHFAKNKLGMGFRLPRLFDNLKSMLGIDFDASPRGHIDFYKSMTMLGVTAVLRDIKYKARIMVHGPTLIGVCDTWGYLEEGQIYVKTRGQKGSTTLLGRVVVTRSPVIHPGDVQIAEAVDVPYDHPLATLVNVVVFSSKGKRPLPSMLGGGDLDGDLFNVLTDERLIPPRECQPGEYKPADPPEPLNRPAEMTDVADFVCNYILNDVVGQIASRHLEISDFSPQGVFDEKCLKLAELASHAVDFTKSGVPVNRWEIPRTETRFKPDFMAREDEMHVYKSRKALGEMFRAVPVQKYFRPELEDMNNVDASVLHKILVATEAKYTQLSFGKWNAKRAAYVWKVPALEFCTECEKIGYRNSFSQRDTHRLGEEELAVGQTGSLKPEHGELDMMHKARVQMSELVRRLRGEIKDMKDGDEDIDDMGDIELENDDEGQTVLVKKEEVEELDDASFLARLAKETRVKREKDDDEVEIIEPGMSIKEEDREVSPASREGDETEASEDEDEDEDEIQETVRPDWRVMAAGRAFGACVYAQETLEADKKVPFGIRLFSLVAVETLLSVIRDMATSTT